MRTLISVATAAALLTCGSAQAGVMRVSIADLDLSRPADVTTAHQRIQRAVRSYCGVLEARDRAVCKPDMLQRASVKLETARAGYLVRMAAR